MAGSMNLTVAPVSQPERVRAELEEVAGLVDPDLPGWTRSAMTDPDLEARHWVKSRMEALGLNPHIDAAGNVIGIWPGRVGGRQLMTGSHTDTVPSGGRFDGMVGVVGALEAVRAMQEADITLDHDLIVVDFFNEEPNRFGISCVGSRALTGVLDASVLENLDEENVRFADSLAGAQVDAAQILGAGWDWEKVDAFVELHIEQGPLLESLGTQIGLVETITGISRFRALFTGQRDHAGTAGMDIRRDAGCAAAGTVLAVERIAQQGAQTVDGAKGTVGGVSFTPAAVNVVTEAAEMRGEFRSPRGSWLQVAEEQLTSAASQEAAARGASVTMDWLPTQLPRPMDTSVLRTCAEAVDELGLSRATLFSGAEHDAALIAQKVPAAMLFIPSAGGRSHCPEEWTDLDDIMPGVTALTETLRRLDRTRRR